VKQKRPEIEIPQEPGYYLWYILDLGYMNVGMVHVMKDSASHLERLRTDPLYSTRKTYYIYQNEKGDTLTMYHQAHDHLPFLHPDNRPQVDGYIPFEWGWIKFKD
jgi:hypothetical protein